MAAERDDGLGIVIGVFGVAIIVLVGISSALGSCPSSVGIESRVAEGLLILTQGIGMIGTVILLASAWVLYSKSKKPYASTSRLSYPWLILTGIVFVIISGVGSGWVTSHSAGLAPCVDGLFSWVPF